MRMDAQGAPDIGMPVAEREHLVSFLQPKRRYQEATHSQGSGLLDRHFGLICREALQMAMGIDDQSGAIAIGRDHLIGVPLGTSCPG